MEYIYIGGLVNTHGIKGEVRILSDFKYKNDVFKHGFNLYIGKDKIKETINTYRVHKNYDMVTFIGINDINDVLKYKGMNVYINKEELNIDGILDEDIIGMNMDYSSHHFIFDLKNITLNDMASSDYIISNNGTLKDLEDETQYVCSKIKKR